ncbi:unnamed protein product [Camellia sinensis]
MVIGFLQLQPRKRNKEEERKSRGRLLNLNPFNPNLQEREERKRERKGGKREGYCVACATTMEEERQRDLRVPLIFGLFFVSCLTGGILLLMWVFEIDGSQPWFASLSMVLISFPWVFWFLAYIYTFMKACFRRGGCVDGHNVSKHGNHAKPVATTTTTTNKNSPHDSPVNSPNNQRQVHFGEVVVIGGDDSSKGKNGQHDGACESSVASSRESETPLTLSVSS